MVKHSFVQPFELMFANRNSSNQHPDGSGQDPRMVFIRDNLEFNPGPFSVHLHLPEMYFMLIKVKLKQTAESKNCLLCKKICRSSPGYYFLCCVRMAVKFLCICKGKVESICSLLLLFQSFLSRFLIFMLWRLVHLMLAWSNTPTPFILTLHSYKPSPPAAQEIECRHSMGNVEPFICISG